MAAKAIADPLFLDTSLIVAATIEAHPAHKVASAFIDAQVAEARPMLISLQVCREFLVVLTRQPVSGRVITLAESQRGGLQTIQELDLDRGDRRLIAPPSVAAARGNPSSSA